MKEISNDDFKRVVRLLKVLSKTQGKTLREKEAIRQATLLVRKFERTKT